jgi:DNA ligase (NAD+)
VFTGVRLSKEDKEIFESNGGVIKDSVSKNATHLVQKSAESESSKSKKAKDLGLSVISLQDFLGLIK